MSGTLQSNSGPVVLATYVARNVEIAPTLGRNLASGPNGTATVQLLPEGALYEDRSLQIDFRASRAFRLGRARLRGMFDLYNVLNDNTVLVQNNQYGPAWREPTFILPGRTVKFGFEADF